VRRELCVIQRYDAPLVSSPTHAAAGLAAWQGRVASREAERNQAISAPCPPEDEDAEAAAARDTTRRRDSLREGGSSAGAALAERNAAAAMADDWAAAAGCGLRPAGGGMRGERDKLPRAPVAWMDPFHFAVGRAASGLARGGPIWARRLTEEGRRLFLSGPP